MMGPHDTTLYTVLLEHICYSGRSQYICCWSNTQK